MKTAASIGLIGFLVCGGYMFRFAYENRNVAMLRKSSLTTTTQTMSMHDSFSLFNENDDVWEKRKHRANISIKERKDVDYFNYDGSGDFFQKNWEPNFSCALEERIGRRGDGGKWVCDVVNLQNFNPCVIYSFGSNGEISFESDLINRLPHCDIHIFDHTLEPSISNTIPSNLHFHKIGLGVGQNKLPLEDILKLLNHTHRHLEILKIDIEGGEYDIKINHTSIWIRQILIEIHPNKIKEMDRILHDITDEHFVIFHKEPNIQYPYDLYNFAIEFAFLKLHSSFWI